MDNEGLAPKRRHFTPLAFIFAVLVLTAIAMIIWYFWPSSKPSHPVSKGSSNSQATQKPKQSNKNETKSASGSGNSTTPATPKSGSTSTGGSSSNPAGTQPATGPSTLSNTGPGNTLAVFLGITAIAGFGHFLYHRRNKA